MILETNERFTVVRPENLQDWLKERTNGIGASELASILGLNEYCTPLQYFAKKQNEIECAAAVDMQFNNIIFTGTFQYFNCVDEIFRGFKVAIQTRLVCKRCPLS